MPTVEVEFLEDHGCCWEKGQKGKLLVHVADILEKRGIVKRVQGPDKNKMVEAPAKAKGHNITGYKG